MLKKILLTLLGVLVVVGIIAGVKAMQIKSLMAMGAQQHETPVLVTASPSRLEKWDPAIPAIGSLSAVEGVTVSAELGGKVTKIAFEAGSTVKAGDLLVQLDTSTEEAQLRAAEAAADLAKITLNRSRELIGSKTISQSEYDTANAQYKQALAQADGIRAVIAKKTIRAPFDGHLGIRLVNTGQILGEGAPVVSLQALNPIYVNFLLPQQRLGQLAGGLTVRVTSDAAPDHPVTGKITAIDPEVETATRNVRVQATLDNRDQRLRPGMFVNVDVVLPQPETVLVIPNTAVLNAPYGDTVFVVEEKTVKDEKTGETHTEKRLRQEIVRVGSKRGDFVAISSGNIKEGDSVVTSGVFKLRPNSLVTVDNTLAPDSQLAPKPADS
jgi:membrane fusion protein (multidrug efflux system)